MSFDEDLQQTLDAFSTRLREQIAAEVQARVDEVRAEMAAVRNEAEAELGAALDAVKTELQESQAQLKDAREQAMAAETRANAADGRVEAAEDRAKAAETRANAAETSAQAAEMNVHAAQASAQAAEERAQTAEAQAKAAPAPEAAVDDREGLARAMRAIDTAWSIGDILNRLVDGSQGDAARAAVFLIRGGRFEGFRFAGFTPDPSPPESVAVPLAEGGVLADAVARAATTQAGPDTPVSVPAFARGATGRTCLAVPMMLGEQAVAVFYADTDGAGPFRPALLEILARHAGQRLAMVTAFKAARAASPPAAAPAAPRRTDEEDEEGARRFARLLVSEIRLYHETDVAEGREHRDLGTRLASEIARARALYEQRIPPDVRHRADYFHAELVRTLADGDARLLEASS